MEPLLKSLELWLKPAAKFLITNEFTLIWCGVTFLYFLYWIVVLLWRALPLRATLARALQPLADVHDSAKFTRVYEDYAKKISAEKSLQHAWNEFAESLIYPSDGEQSTIQNTHEIASFFNDASVVQPIVQNRFLDTVPSHLVGLGILGTFLGLAAGVGVASGSLSSEKLQDVQDALGALLNGASLAFITSIFGLGFSLVFLWIERLVIGSVHRRLNAWVTKLEACVELATAEGIAVQQLEQQRRQTAQLERFNSDLVFALEKALDERVTQRLGPQLEKVVDAIDALRADRTDTNVAAMQRLVENFSQRLTQSTGQEMQAMGATLREVGDRLQTLMSAMQDSQEQTRTLLDQAMHGARESLASGSTAVADSLRGITAEVARALSQASSELTTQVASAGVRLQQTSDATAQSIAASLGGFTEGVARLERTASSQGELAARIAELTGGLRSAGDTLLQAHRGFSDSLQPFREMIRSLDGASARVANSLAGTQTLVGEVAATGRLLHEENQKIASIWRDYHERFEGVDAALTSVFEKLDEGLQHYQAQVRDYLKEVDQQVSKAIGLLGSAIVDLQETLEDRSERLQARR